MTSELCEWWKEIHYTVKTLRSGQARPYGPTEHVWEVTITDANDVPVGWNDTIVKNKLRCMLGMSGELYAWQSEKGSDDAEWHHTQLIEFRKTAPGIYRVATRQEYLD